MHQDRRTFKPHLITPLGVLKGVIVGVTGVPFCLLIVWYCYLLLVEKDFGPLSIGDVVLGILLLAMAVIALFMFFITPVLLFAQYRNSYLEVGESGFRFRSLLGGEGGIKRDEIEKGVLENDPKIGERIYVYKIDGGQRIISKRGYPEGYAAALEKLKEWGKLQEMNSTMDAEE